MDNSTRVSEVFGVITADLIRTSSIKTGTLTIDATQHDVNQAFLVAGDTQLLGNTSLIGNQLLLGTTSSQLGFYGHISTTQPSLQQFDLSKGIPALYTLTEKINEIISTLELLGLVK